MRTQKPRIVRFEQLDPRLLMSISVENSDLYYGGQRILINGTAGADTVVVKHDPKAIGLLDDRIEVRVTSGRKTEVWSQLMYVRNHDGSLTRVHKQLYFEGVAGTDAVTTDVAMDVHMWTDDGHLTRTIGGQVFSGASDHACRVMFKEQDGYLNGVINVDREQDDADNVLRLSYAVNPSRIAVPEFLDVREVSFWGSVRDDVFRSDAPYPVKARGGDGRDTIYGGPMNDELNGDVKDDYIFGQGGNDLIIGYSWNDGDDHYFGGAGRDTIDAGGGRDFVHGDAGNDLVHGNAGNDELYGDEGNDTLVGGAGYDKIAGGNGADLIHGGSGSDTLLGDAGNDTMFGESDNDFMFGGVGIDSLDGGGGLNMIVQDPL